MGVKSLRWQYLRLMHFPLPLCVFSFATLGAVISPIIYLDRLLWTYLIVFTNLCLASYSFDELRGRPLHTTIPESHLRALGWTGVAVSSSKNWRGSALTACQLCDSRLRR